MWPEKECAAPCCDTGTLPDTVLRHGRPQACARFYGMAGTGAPTDTKADRLGQGQEGAGVESDNGCGSAFGAEGSVLEPESAGGPVSSLNTPNCTP